MNRFRRCRRSCTILFARLVVVVLSVLGGGGCAGVVVVVVFGVGLVAAVLFSSAKPTRRALVMASVIDMGDLLIYIHPNILIRV